MTEISDTIWLVYNEASGSNDERSLAELEEAIAAAGCEIVGRTCFPDDPAPGPSDLDAAGAGVLAIFGGDGTISSVIRGVYGWGGAVLPLPGGTMNLLSRRMHGDDAMPSEILARIGRGKARKTRPSLIRSRHGDGLTGVLAGPGTEWNEVREAMREANLLEMLTSTTEAIAWSANGPKVACRDVDCGRPEGYAAITINPEDEGLHVKGYFAETIGDYARHGVALLQHDFRNGPHDDLGRHETIRLVCPAGEPMGLLIDGEPFDGAAEEVFRLVPSEIDIVTTSDAR
ncbi:diacylglycerol kinase [Novosphingobium sp. PC22D]|uniref:diacylglycerol kinase family protein n=1 Tax=Novosphingobium sp. PC22D TaxID=1962403 RepID=UPI000BF0EAEA|nr:diacylglycerol kinase family protein [Novosphingobium sp. PC22D]PEQ12158.1 diacylglycerol kinase [Novosphingobium sp. PC22D]